MQRFRISFLLLLGTLLIGLQSRSQTFYFRADSVQGANGTTVDLSVRVRNFTNIASFQGSVNWGATVASFQSVTNFGPFPLSMANFGTTQTASGILTFSWNDPQGGSTGGITLADSTVIFTLRYTIVGTTGQQTPVTISNSPLTIEVTDRFLNQRSTSSIAGQILVTAVSPPCGISALAAGTGTACVPGTNAYTKNVIVTYANPPASGSLVVNGQFFTITASPQTVTLTNLQSTGLPVNVTAYFSATPACSLTVNSLFTAPVPCNPGACFFRFRADSVTTQSGAVVDVPVRAFCFRNIASIQGTVNWNPAVLSFGSISNYGPFPLNSGNFGFNQTSSGNLTFSWNDPMGGSTGGITYSDSTVLFTLRFTATGTVGQSSAISFTSSPLVIEVTDSSRTVIYSTSTTGNVQINAGSPLCSITGITAGTQSACFPASNTYNQQVTVSYLNQPASGTLNINGQSFAITGTPQTVTLTGLVSNGAAVNVTAQFSASPTCTFTANNLFTARSSCYSGGFQLYADSVSGPNASTVDVRIRVTGFVSILSMQGTLEWNPAIATFNSMQSYGLPGMGIGNFGTTQTANGKLMFSWDDVSLAGVSVPDTSTLFTIRFNIVGTGTQATPIRFTSTMTPMEIYDIVDPNPIPYDTTTGNILVSGPAPGCGISAITAGAQGACSPSTNTYSQNVTVTFSNPPMSGNLVVNGQNFTIGTSPQTVTLTNLTSNGLPVTVTANFSVSPSCSLVVNNLFTAPASCAAGGVFTFFADSVQGAPATYVDVPVRVRYFNSILSAQGTVSWNTAVATYNTISYMGLPGMTTGNFGTTLVGNGTLAFSWDDQTFLGVSLPDSAIIFTIRFLLVGNLGTQTPVTFVNSMTPLEVVDVGYSVVNDTSVNGNILISGSNVIISGQCIHPNIGDSIRSVKVVLAGTSADSLVTGLNGRYTFSTVVSGGNYTVTPTKNNDTIRTNGVTALDLVLTQRHILNLSRLNSPYKILAADVNNSNTVTAIDLVLTRRFILGLDTMFSGARLWRFISTSHVFADTTNPWTPSPPPFNRSYTNVTVNQVNQNFFGMKLGDVNYSWNSSIAKTEYSGKLNVYIEDKKAKPGEEIWMPVRVKGFRNMAGYQLSMRWNPDALEFLEARNGILPAVYGEQWAGKGILTAVWTDELGGLQSLDDDSYLMMIRFRVKAAEGTESFFMVGSDFTPAEAYDENLSILKIEDYSAKVWVDANAPAQGLQISGNYPNPFHELTSVHFSLDKAGDVQMQIRNVKGETVYERTQAFAAGENEISWDGKTTVGEKAASGMYFIHLESSGFGADSKVILIRK